MYIARTKGHFAYAILTIHTWTMQNVWQKLKDSLRIRRTQSSDNIHLKVASPAVRPRPESPRSLRSDDSLRKNRYSFSLSTFYVSNAACSERFVLQCSCVKWSLCLSCRGALKPLPVYCWHMTCIVLLVFSYNNFSYGKFWAELSLSLIRNVLKFF